MNDDQLICLCFHVSRRKVVQFIRKERPRTASQLSECYGAGTGCGWCRPFLKRLWQAENPDAEIIPGEADYAEAREKYRDQS